jgi:hypothetical protein
MKLWLFLFLSLLLIAHPVAAQDVDNCDSYPNVPVNLNPVFDEPQYDFSHNLADLQSIANDRLHSIPHYHAVAMGITRYEPILQFRIPMEVVTPPDGLACAHVQHVDVTVGYRQVTVYIANEIPADSCGFNETLAHEQKHVAVNRQLLQEFAPQIEERLKSYLKQYGVFRVQNAEYAEKLLREKLQVVMDEMIQQMQAENVRRQQLVDSRSEYDRLAHVCHGDLARIAQHFQQTGH